MHGFKEMLGEVLSEAFDYNVVTAGALSKRMEDLSAALKAAKNHKAWLESNQKAARPMMDKMGDVIKVLEKMK